MVNYADLMTELVCFFVILYALSAALNKEVGKAKDEVEKMMEKGELQGEVKVGKEGMEIRLDEKGGVPFFKSGSADMTRDMEGKIAILSPVLAKLARTQEIVIEGHTDNQRISNDYFDSNWELSTARATNVVRTMIDKHGFPPQRMAAIGYGEFRPLALNDTENSQAGGGLFVKNPVQGRGAGLEKPKPGRLRRKAKPENPPERRNPREPAGGDPGGPARSPQ